MNPNESRFPEPDPKPGKNPPENGAPSTRTIAIRAMAGFLIYAVAFLSSRTGIEPVVLVVIAIALAIARVGRGFPLGIFIGVGLTLLGIGVCIARLSI